MMLHPKITICIPVYNMEDCIARAIISALNQAYDNFEVIVLDNQSSDATFERAKAIQDPRLSVFRNETNLGAYGNHNRCLEYASSEWVKFLHGDDELLPSCIATFVKYISECPDDIALIACGGIRLDQNDLEFQKTDIPDRLFIMRQAPRLLTIQGNMIGTPTMTLIHKERFRAIGWFDREMEPASDGDAWINLMKHFPSAIIPEHLVKLRDDPLPDFHAKARLGKKFCNQIFRQIEKWYRLDSEQSTLPFNRTDYATWACTESFPYWSAAIRYAVLGDVCLLQELLSNLIGKKILIRSFCYFLSKRLRGYGLYSFKRRVWMTELRHLNIEYHADSSPAH